MTSPTLSALTKGHATILIKGGHVDREALHDAHMSVDDDLRQQGVAGPSEVSKARLEPNGKLSVIRIWAPFARGGTGFLRAS